MAQGGDIIADRGKSLEDEFFRREDQRLLEKLRELKQVETTRASLAEASGIKNEAVLDKLLALGIRAEMVAALAVVPLAEVAWADGAIDARERTAVLAAAQKAGVAPGSAQYDLLARWLEHRPDAKLLTAWQHLIQGLGEKMTPAETAALKSALLDNARAVASASGGFLGLGSKISESEEALLKQLTAAFPS